MNYLLFFGWCKMFSCMILQFFQVISFTTKMVQEFSSDRKILMFLKLLLFYPQNRFLVLWNFNFEPKYLGKSTSWNQPYFLMKYEKSFLSPEQNKSKEIHSMMTITITAEHVYVKINVSPNTNLHLLALQMECSFLKFSYQGKRVLSFELLHKWNVNNSIEKVKVYFSIVFDD